MIDRYVYALSPSIESIETDPWGMRRKVFLPLTVVYEKVLTVDKQYKSAKWYDKFRQEVFGGTYDTRPPYMYSAISLANEIGITITEFNALPIHDRAMLLAHAYLQGMAETVRRYRDYMRRSEEKYTKNG